MKWAGYTECKGKMINSYKLSVGYVEGKRRVRHIRKDIYNIKKDLRERMCEDVDWVKLAWDRSQCKAVVISLQVL
jgi:hypothetical protein